MLTFEIAQLAQKSLIYEASLYPKPGLVTPLDSGAHRDMDYRMFIDSSLALLPCFINCFSIGMDTHKVPPTDVFCYLRQAGLQGEESMYKATMGVNTHKGAIFQLGLLCAAAGRLKALKTHCSPVKVAYTASLYVEGIVERELKPLLSQEGSLSAGERAYCLYGIEGARGEAERAFPLVLDALKEFEKLLFEPLSFNAKLVQVLLFIMAKNRDSNLVQRGGIEGLTMVQELALKALETGGMKIEAGKKCIAEMEQVFVERNLSPGGSADILASVLFLKMLKDKEKA